MKKRIIIFMFFAFCGSIAFSQVGVGTETPNGALDVEAGSNNYGLVNPRVVNTTSVTNPQTGNVLDGTVVYDLSENCLKVKANNIWSGCLNIPPADVNSLNCAAATRSGNLTTGKPTNITISIPYTGGNGGNFGAMNITSTGVTGLTASNPGGKVADGNGILVLTLTGTPAGDGNASFTVSLGSQSCSFDIPVSGGTITSLNCAGATATGTFTPGVAGEGSITISYSGGNGGSYDAIEFHSTGVTGLTASAAGGNFSNGVGSIVLDVVGVPNSGGTASFLLTVGGQSCTVSIVVKYPLVTVLTIGNGSGYFPTGSTYYSASGTSGTANAGGSSITNIASGKWTTVLSDIASSVEFISFVPGTGSATQLKTILQDPNKIVAMIYNVYNSSGTSGNAAINQVIYDNWVSKGKIYFVSSDEGGFNDDLTYWRSNKYGLTGSDNDSYSFDATKLVEPGDIFPTKYGVVSSIALKPGGNTSNAFAAASVPSNAKIAGYKTQGNTTRVAVFKDMNYSNGKLWVFSDTDAYWQYDTGSFGSSPYMTNSCTATTRDQFSCNLFYYVTRKNLGIPLN